MAMSTSLVLCFVLVLISHSCFINNVHARTPPTGGWSTPPSTFAPGAEGIVTNDPPMTSSPKVPSGSGGGIVTNDPPMTSSPKVPATGG
ncbi:hypothetical protein Scep_011947 [Stephania cephalantha]|uniref:Uncharacterized protein n=1 Tax=Stephania cephalantha TaxID=152367 RepID=A0AAP0JE91_9MAGN